MSPHDWTAIVGERLAQIGGDAADVSLVEELALHVAQAYEDAQERGASDDEARVQALALLDAPELLRRTIAARREPLPARVSAWSRREPSIGARTGISPAAVAADIRYALRLLVRAPVFSAVAILTFAAGIGANTAVFSVINGVLLQPLPYPDADRITLLWMDNRRQGIREDITSYPNYIDWRDQSASYAHMAAWTPATFTLGGLEEPERLFGAAVTASFFDVMQVPPLAGRLFSADDEVLGKDAVVVLSHGLWHRRFGADPGAIGRTIQLNNRPVEVIGVMPASFRWPDRAELWRPLALSDGMRAARGSFALPVIGRLKPNVSVGSAQVEMSGIAARLEAQYPMNRGFGVNVVPLRDQVVGRVERTLVILFAAVGFVLLIACANLANLMMGRTAARRRELAVRSALGAGHARVVRQIVTETFVLALIGAATGVVLSYWATGFFVALGGDSIPRQESIRIDWRVAMFALLLASVATLIAGLIPAVQASRGRLLDALREAGREGGALRRTRTAHLLVTAEVALALVLLTGAGLFARTLWSMQQVERGFDPANVAMMTVSVPPGVYQVAELRTFYARLLERVRAVPGVQSAATASGVLQPLVTNSTVFAIEGQPPLPAEERIEYPVEVVSPGYFETLRIQLASGRSFSDADHADAPPVVVINETFARGAWPGADAIGRRIKPGDEDSQTPWMTVVGVIRDARRADVARAIRPEVYASALQQTSRTQTLVLRTAGDPEAIGSSVRRELRALNPQVPLYAVTTLERELAVTLSTPRFQAVVLVAFAGIALLLASIGIYGVTSHAVNQRTQEVGIRMAMGAVRGDVLRMMLVQHLAPALVGVLIGLAGSALLSRFVRNLLYGVSATDPATFAAVAVMLLVVAAVACWIPARRATRVDPLVALRAD